MNDITVKLGEISRIMGDGYHFTKIRFTIEEWQQQADMGNAQAAEMIKVIETMHRMCVVIEKRG